MATTSFTTEFQLAPSPKVFELIDTADYISQGIVEADVNGVFTIVAPGGGVIYSNTDYSDSGCDIKVSTSRVNQLQINLPVNAADLVEKGIYTITYSVYDKNALEYYTKEMVYDYEYTAPVIDILVVDNIIGKVFSQTDQTDYVVDGITPLVTIVNTLKYPTGIEGGPPPDVVTSGSTLTTDVFFNGTQTSTITATVAYTFSDGLIVTDSLFGSVETLIDGAFYCSIICGLKAFEASLCECTQAQYDIKSKQFTLAMAYVTLIMAEINCNGGDGIDGYLTKIKEIIGECDCGCDGDDNDDYSRITGWGTILGTVGPAGPPGATGTAGSAGAPGVDGSDILLVNDIDVDTPYAGSISSLKDYTLGAGVLAAEGDAIEITTSFTLSTSTSWKVARMEIGGTNVMPTFAGNAILVANGATYLKMVATVSRRTAKTVSILYSWTTSGVFGASLGTFTIWEPSVTIPTLALDNLIDILGATTSPDTIVCNELLIKLLKT